MAGDDRIANLLAFGSLAPPEEPNAGLSRLNFSDVPNWRRREVGGYVAPGRYPRPIENRPDTDYGKLPLSQNIEDRRGEPMTIGRFISGAVGDDPVIGALVNALRFGIDKRDGQLPPLSLPMTPPGSGAEALGANDLYPGMLGFDRYDQWRFDNGLTPGGSVWEKPLKR